jgi:hypothetical protein
MTARSISVSQLTRGRMHLALRTQAANDNTPPLPKSAPLRREFASLAREPDSTTVRAPWRSTGSTPSPEMRRRYQPPSPHPAWTPD